jgi:Fe-S-cluster containining protein
MDTVIDQLCLACGICCTGVLFDDVVLEPGAVAELGALGLPLVRRYGRTRLPQPCPALQSDNRCRIYPQRPARCRQFECALLRSVRAGQLDVPAALRAIDQTRHQADRVRRLLRLLGDRQDAMALRVRFKRLQRQVERHPPDEEMAAAWAALSQAMHELNLQLRRQFYP